MTAKPALRTKHLKRVQPPPGKCWVERAPFWQCCCNCRHHLQVASRVSDGLMNKWVCTGMADEGVVYEDWPKHSVGCELYAPRKKR